ncbi:uncharacterized protein LOC134222559 [Armigeres subalbatus]|uniref:uncharacterized protein LOC134222559 n=1 Tax=Armigeres subalbatus TaxID=124917 RepID=UPI002ED01400
MSGNKFSDLENVLIRGTSEAAKISDVANIDWVPTLNIAKLRSELPVHRTDDYIPGKEDLEAEAVDTDNSRLVVNHDSYEAFVCGLLGGANLISTAATQAALEDEISNETGQCSFSDIPKPCDNISNGSMLININKRINPQSRHNYTYSSVEPYRNSTAAQDYSMKTTTSDSTKNSTGIGGGAYSIQQESWFSTCPDNTFDDGDKNAENAITPCQNELIALKCNNKDKDDILVAYRKELARLQKRVDVLESELSKKQYGLTWINDDRRCKLYTGINSLQTLKILYEYVENSLFQPRCALTKDQLFIMTLRKLRRNTPFVDLAEEYSAKVDS